MLYPIYGPIAAEPSLHLQLQHIARSPAQRLGISYQIVPRCRRAPQQCVVEAGLRPGHEPSHVEMAQILATRSIRAPGDAQLSLGEKIYLANLLAGGINGQPLPLSICRHLEGLMPPGMLTDCMA